MSARSAGRIAAIVTARRLGAEVEPAVPAIEPDEPAEVESPKHETASSRKQTAATAVPTIGTPRPLASAGEVGALQSVVSYIPSEALTIYIAGVAAVNLVQDPSTTTEKAAAVWILWVIAAVANVAFVWLGFKDKFARFSRRDLTVRQTRPLVAGMVVTTLAFFVYALAIPGGIAVSDTQWLPLVLLIGAAVVVGAARVLGISPLKEDDVRFV